MKLGAVGQKTETSSRTLAVFSFVFILVIAGGFVYFQFIYLPSVAKRGGSEDHEGSGKILQPPQTSEAKILEGSADPLKTENFVPKNLVVVLGLNNTVIWSNNDAGIFHTVTSDSGSELNSPLFQGGQTWTHTFKKPGVFAYHCTPHPWMKGVVTVASG